MARPKPLSSDMLEEYKLCHQRAASLGDLVWKTATLLGAGSIFGIVTLASLDPPAGRMAPWLVLVVALVAIGFLVAWRRMAGRWFSIEYALLRRMEHIERESGLRATLYSARLDGRVDFSRTLRDNSIGNPYLDPLLQEDLAKICNHQREGIRAAVTFITEINIAAWIALAFFSLSPLLAHTFAGRASLAIVTTVAVIVLVFFVWRLINMVRQV
jgi:hypothetical protein